MPLPVYEGHDSGPDDGQICGTEFCKNLDLTFLKVFDAFDIGESH